MSSFRILSPLSLLSFSLLLQLAASYVTLDNCGGANLPPNDPYNVSITNLLGSFVTNTPSTGFASGSVGQGVNQVYGLALCRGDLNNTACEACVERLSKNLQTTCQTTQGQVSDDECEVKYSSTNFLGQVDQGHWYYAIEATNVSDPVEFNRNVMALMTNLSQDATASPKLYAVGELGIGNSTTIYGLNQCTRDLSAADCESCLIQTINGVPKLLYGKNGGKIVGGSCNVRFEIFQFFSVA